MIKLTVLICLLISFLFSCTAPKKPATQLITLSNKIIEIGILPEVGGRLVRVSLIGQKNMIHADSTQWNEPQELRPSLNPTKPFKAYNGHITWLNPQSKWWTRQDSFPELKKAQSSWPPDPYLTLAPYKITQQKTNEIRLAGPKSPFTKVQFTKTFRIERNTVFLSTVAHNISRDTVSWGLWHNTRMNGWDAVFVQALPDELLRSEYNMTPGIHKPELRYKDGFYSYESENPGPNVVYKSKSFFSVAKPLIAGFHQNQWLIIRGKAIDPEMIHPDQGHVELYVENSSRPDNDLQELEMQFAYEKMAPGDSIEASETWEILPGNGTTDKAKLLDELRSKLSQEPE